MPIQAIKLLPGINTEQTQTLNETSWTACNLVRFFDTGLLQKLGGWTQYFGTQISSPIRALLAWEGISNDFHLGVGAQSSLSVITAGGQTIITPQTTLTNPTPNFTTTAGSNVVGVTDAGITASVYETVIFDTPVSVGGIILNGVYTIPETTGTNSYQILASANALVTNSSTVTITIASPGVVTWTGHKLLAGSQVVFTTTGALPTGITAGTVYYVISTGLTANTFEISATLGGTVINTSGSQSGTHTGTDPGQVPVFSTTNNASAISVNFPYHGYSVGSTANFIAPTTVAGLTIQGLYTVTAVADNANFTINSPNLANATTTAAMNGGNAQLLYYIQIAPQLPGSGWGINAWGAGGWGTGLPAPPITGTPITATDWTLDNWGNTLIACPAGGPIFTWAPATGVGNAGIIANAPTMNDGIFIAMPQRILVAWGASVLGIQDPLLIAWSDAGNYNVWTASSTNQAGTFRLSSGSKVVGGFQAPGQALLWTDLDIWIMQYLGAPLVWGFNKVATGCGLIGRHAMGALGGVVYWMSQKQFFTLAGGAVQPLPCHVWDVIFQNLDLNNLGKIRCAPNSNFNEIAWYYPSISGVTGEVDSYVKYNAQLQVWDYGTLQRTAWIDQSVLGPPIGGTATGFIYQHETSNDAAGQSMDSWAQSGYAMISEGNDFTFVDWFLPDFKYGTVGGSLGPVLITLSHVNYPGDTPNIVGPFAVQSTSQYFDPRLRNRQISIKVESNSVGSWFRIGNARYRGAPDGRR